MSYAPNGDPGMMQVNFHDEDHAEEEGDLEVDFAPRLSHHDGDAYDSEALIDQMDVALDPLPRRQKRGGWCKTLLVFIILGGIIGTVSYFMFRPNDDDKGTTSTASTSAFLTPPPANLAAKCATEGDECRQACEPSECCDFPANLALSCLSGNEAQCLTYHQHCSVMTGGNIVADDSALLFPPAPPNLKDLCTADKIGTVDGFMECQEACQPASCCYEDGGSGGEPATTCTKTGCTEYAECLILSAADHVHDAIGPYIKDQCSDLDTTPGRSNCLIACSHALCCFTAADPGERFLATGTTADCPHPDDAFCSQYSLCNALEGDANTVTSKAEVDRICKSTHTSLCEAVCERGACCFASERCPTEDVKCDDYAGCTVLFGDTRDDDSVGGGSEGGSAGGESTGGSTSGGSDVPVAGDGGGSTGSGTGTPSGGDDDPEDDIGVVLKVDVDDACVTFDPAQANAASSACAKLCENVGCCFETEGCSGGLNCKVYEECDAFFGIESDDSGDGSGGGDDPEDDIGVVLKIDVDDACTDYDPGQASSATSECAKLCENVGCCFETSGCSASISCKVYEECDAFFGVESDDGGDSDEEGTSTGGGAQHNSATASEIFDACENHAEELVQTPGSQSLCQLVCEQYKCCFEECSVPSDVTCDTGTSCTKIFTGSSGSTGGSGTSGSGTGGSGISADVAIEDACNNHSEELIQAPGMPTLCQTLCEDYHCCFDVNACDVPAGTECGLGTECSVLHENAGSSSGAGQVTGGSSSSLHDDIMASCEEGSDRAKCESLCDAGRCCYESQNCEVAADLDCKVYDGCLVVFAVDGEDEVPTSGGAGSDEGANTDEYTAEDVNAACSADAVSSMCSKICAGTGCCFVTGLSCGDVDCAKFAACSKVHGR